MIESTDHDLFIVTTPTVKANGQVVQYLQPGFDFNKPLLWDVIDCSRDESTVLTTGTIYEERIQSPYRCLQLEASLKTPSTTGDVTIDVHYIVATVFSTKITIEAGKTSSRSAASRSVLTNYPTYFAADTVFRIDVDDAGSSADAVGLKVYRYGNYMLYEP